MYGTHGLNDVRKARKADAGRLSDQCTSAMGTNNRLNVERQERRSVRRDIVVCLGWGLLIAMGFSIWVLALYLRRGSAPFENVGTTLWAVILLYFCAAILVGPIVGLLLPLARTTRSGSALVGIVAAIPFYAMARITVEGFTSWARGEAFVILVLALLVGAPVGLAYRRIFGDPL